MQKVSELIPDETSLGNIAQIKEQMLKDKSTVEYQLEKESKSRFAEVQRCLEIVNAGTRYTDILREKLKNIGKLGKDNKCSIKSYEIINELARIYEVISKTTVIYNKISNFAEFCSRLDANLDQELGQDILETRFPTLLETHYMITAARDFYDQMIVMANVGSEDTKRTIKRVFSRLPSQIEKFDRLLESIVYDLIEAARMENRSLLLRFFRIIDIEDREDMKILETREVLKTKELEMESNKVKKLPGKLAQLDEDIGVNPIEYPTDQALFEEIMNGTIQTRTQPRGYKDFLYQKIKKAVSNLFDDVRKEYSSEKQFDVLDNLDWVFNELLIVKNHLSKYCPKEWNIFKQYYDAYHREMNVLILGLINSEPESLIILRILDFDKTFIKTLKKDFGFTKDEAISVIGENEKEKLLQDYLDLIIKKMREWLQNLQKTELAVFEARSTPPHTDSENLLFLDGTKTCFQIFTQQVEVAAGSGQAKILVGVISKFCELISERQNKWMDAINYEVNKCIQYNHMYEEDPASIRKEDESTGGLVEYSVAVANDQMKAADYAVAISQKYSSMVSKIHERAIINSIEETLDGFADVAKCSTNGLVSLIFDDLRKPYSEIFSKNWYIGNQAQQISDTLYEYLSDIRSQMNPFVYSKFVESVIEETILKFIEALKFEHKFKNKQSKFLDCMKRDFEIFYKLFIQFVSDEEKYIIDEKFKLMEFFMDFSCSPNDIILETWRRCLQVYWDTPITLLRSILKCRKEIDSSTSKRLLAEAQSILKDPKYIATIKSQELQPTFICRFT